MKRYLLILIWSSFVLFSAENVLAYSKTHLGTTYTWWDPDPCALYASPGHTCTVLSTYYRCPNKAQIGTYLAKPTYQSFRIKTSYWTHPVDGNGYTYHWKESSEYYFENHPAYPNGQWFMISTRYSYGFSYTDPRPYAEGGVPSAPFPCPEPCTGTKGLAVVQCVLKQFERKFPFDIWGFLPANRALTCPTLTFLEKTFQICWIYDYIAAFKYPVIASLLIQLFIKI